MRYILILFLTLSFTQELQVEGYLKVTGSIDAQGNPITNVGNPIASSDAVNMGFLQTEIAGLAAMKPERFYKKLLNEPDNSISLIVPIGKTWKIISAGEISALVNGVEIILSEVYGGSNSTIWIFPNDAITISGYGNGCVTIFEYSISGSGSEQGLDYIEP